MGTSSVFAEWRLALVLRLHVLRSRLVRRAVGPHAAAILAHTARGDFLVAPEDVGVGRRLRRDGAVVDDEIDAVLAHCRPDSRVLVVGGHVGSLALPLAASVASVTVLEANPDTFGLLRRNVAINGLANVDVHAVAANDRGGTLRFLLNRANSGGSKRVPQHARTAYYYDRPDEVEVPAVVLDDYFAGRTFDVIVMDIEGSEVFALRGMPRLLGACRHLFVEFLPHHLRDVAGVGVAEFLAPLARHFAQLTIPSQGRTIPAEAIARELEAMFARDAGDPSLVFHRDAPSA